CGSKLKECVGHFGYIELARPIIHIKFVPIILNFLRSTCRDCGHVLYPKVKMDKARAELDRLEREEGIDARRRKLKALLENMSGTPKCPHCNAKQYKISLEKPYTYLENEKRITPIEIRTRLERIPDEDCELLGLNPKFARPEWAVLTILAIPPVTIRPSITLESGERSEDDLTHKLGDIIRINQRLFENINAGAPEIIIEDLWDLLQYHITTFFDNSVAQLPPARHRSGQPLKTITERIKSKEGRIRHNLAGKRTNFSARTVISPDPMIALNEVGVPKVIAMKLTVPERVTEWNMAYVKKFIERGPGKYPGANYITRPDGKKKKITDETKEQLLEELQPGYAVERHLLDGDIAIFNRQPSLHRMSMMCHRVKVLPDKTFRLNPAICHPYNADFDGDEMNLHIPQTEEARAEAEILMEVQTQLVSPRYGLSVIGCVQDAISGNFVLTRELQFPYLEAVGLLISIGEEHWNRLPKKETIEGTEIFSCLLPPDFNFQGVSKNGESVIISNGKLKSGIMDSANLGQGAGLMLRNIHKQYGETFTVDFLHKLYKLALAALLYRGFSVSISDIDLPTEAVQKIEEELNAGEDMVDKLIGMYYSRELETFPGKTLEETLEMKILEVLNKVRNKTGKLVTDFGKQGTGCNIMTRSGARGNPINMAQMAACVGQQALRGRRIDKGYRNRTLSSFKENDLRPAARGFIRHGFKAGLHPAEFFFAAMTGRDSLMDTALRTPKSGYLYRRLANAMQDLRVDYDETVRDASGRVIQFNYGEDNIDVAKSEGGTINIKKIVQSVVGVE
ncbi:MAG TPA: DNA-directed RNA polymerase subunit A', partial [Candidatus Nanoarchaeia archaeon]|nr:DNA-directed RNA polymerase subunit A' [Candidatus Nanoarchaeia archaeon]